MTQNDALTAAVQAEFAAIFAYGVSTAFVGSDNRLAVGRFIAEHRVRRDALNSALVAAGEPEQVSAAGYTMPVEVTDEGTAVTALLAAEETTEQAYRALVEQADEEKIRRLGVDGLTEGAARTSFWRAASGISPATVAFPGATPTR